MCPNSPQKTHQQNRNSYIYGKIQVSSILIGFSILIEFSIIFTIHFGGFPTILGTPPYGLLSSFTNHLLQIKTNRHKCAAFASGWYRASVSWWINDVGKGCGRQTLRRQKKAFTYLPIFFAEKVDTKFTKTPIGKKAKWIFQFPWISGAIVSFGSWKISDIFCLFFTPNHWGNDPIWRSYFFRWVETTN